jgi:nickel-type superoxide dismutase maturation protease
VGHGQATRYSARAANRRGRAAGPPAAAQPGVVGSEARWSDAIAFVTATLVLGWSAWRAVRRFDRVEVFGTSMAPALLPGDHVLVWKTRSVRPGDVVAAPDPRRAARSVLKRVADVTDEGLYLLGDNPEHSTDSRQWGRVPVASVEGKAVYRYAPPGRAGRLGKPVSNGN